MNRTIFWIDLETTSLDEKKGRIVEIAYAFTRQNGNIIEDGSYLVQPFAMFDIDNEMHWDEPARKMHRESGLIDEWKSSERNKTYKVCSYIRETLSVLDKKPYLGGSGPHFDRKWLKFHYPKVLKHVHYRHVDVRTMKIFAQNANIDIPDQFQEKHHRAMDDLKRDIHFYQYMIKSVDNLVKIDEGMYEGLGE